MDPWEMFCEMTRRVVEDQNCMLDVYIADGTITMQLMPLGDYEGDEEE